MTSGQLRPLADGDPRQLGRFTVLGLLGEGGMGRVFLGYSPGGWAVAIKVIHAGLAADPAFRARFSREVATARAVGGFYTAPVVDADTAAERPWLAVAYVAGPSLADAVVAGGPLPLRSVRRLGLGLAEALQAIHGAGVVHRDLKPSNVLLAADGPRVIDFGIARAAERSSLTRTGTILGSAGFMAPEQITGGGMGPAADVFALGAVLTFAVTGQGPFGEGRTEALAYRVVYVEPTLDGVPGPVREIVARCLAKDPRYRPGPGEVMAALAAIPDTGPSTGEGWLPEPVERLIGLHHAVATAAMTASPARGPRAFADDSAAPTRTTGGTGLSGPVPPGHPTPPTSPVPYAVPGAASPQWQAPTPQWQAASPQQQEVASPGWDAPSPRRGVAGPRRGAARKPLGWVFGAVTLVILVAVAAFVAVNRLSAKTPTPARPAGLAASSPTGASSPASAATPTTSAAVPGPAAVVQAYYAAINNHDCGKAWSLGGDNISAAQGETYQQFCRGFSSTSRDDLTIDSVAGNTVTVTIVAEHTDGSSQSYQGSYVVGDGVIDSANVQAAG